MPTIRRSASALAGRRRGSAITRARSASVPGIGGRQSTSLTSAPWAATASANRPTPAVTTRGGGPVNRELSSCRPVMTGLRSG